MNGHSTISVLYQKSGHGLKVDHTNVIKVTSVQYLKQIISEEIDTCDI